MQFVEGQRASFTVVGTVITQSEFMERLGSMTELAEEEGREKTHLVLDNGILVRIDTTDDEKGVKLTSVKPRYWPPEEGDVWQDDHGESWYVAQMDFGHRSGIRFKSYGVHGETIRSAQWFLDNNVRPSLVIRGDSFVS